MERPLRNKDLPLSDRNELCALLGRFEKGEFNKEVLWKRIDEIISILMRNKLIQRNRLHILAFYALCESHTNSLMAQIEKIEELIAKQKKVKT